MCDMPRITNGPPPRVFGVAIAASGDQTHQSAMQVSLMYLEYQRRQTDVPTTQRHDGARRSMCGHVLPSAIFIFPKKTTT
jgi:hypothetical protein